MVKLGARSSDKLKKGSVDDGFDNVPLITPLEVEQLQHNFPEKVIVKTAIRHSLHQRSKFSVSRWRKLKKNFDVSEKMKISGLIFIMLAFLTSLVLLLMFQTLWYHRLTCPAGFVLQKHDSQSHCVPENLPDLQSRTKLSSNINTRPQLASPWLPVLAAVKEDKMDRREREERMKRERRE